MAKPTKNTIEKIKIFISHHNSDAKILSEIRTQWEDLYGIKTFLAHEDIKIGEHDLDRIEKEIRETNIFLYIGSDDAHASIFCQQEIGMAKALDKPMLLFHKESLPQGFIQRIQSKRYTNLEEIFPHVISNLIRNSRNDELIHNFKLIFGENTDNQCFEKRNPNTWNDYGFYTSFEIKVPFLEETIDIKMGFIGQRENENTYDKLPEKFPFLRNKFFSRVYDDESLEITQEQRKALSYLLNDVEQISNDELEKIIDEPVLKKSLFRYDENGFETLKQKLR